MDAGFNKLPQFIVKGKKKKGEMYLRIVEEREQKEKEGQRLRKGEE